MKNRYTMWKIMLMALFMAMLEMGEANAQPKVPCFFIFGDSLSDGGNNNGLASTAKADYLPYGIDFPYGPTGRFTNGKTIVDVIGDLIGMHEFIPSFPRSQQGSDPTKGVNYASGSAGIRPKTGYLMGQRVPMDAQLVNHKITVSKIKNSLGRNTTTHLGQCLYSVYIGSNDWMIDFYNPKAGTTGAQFTPQKFADELIKRLTDQLGRLQEMGARKIVLFGLSPLGCLPPLTRRGICLNYVNDALQMYNDKLKLLVGRLNHKYSDSQFIFIDTLKIAGRDLSGLGHLIKNIPCCPTVGPQCVPYSTPCKDRDRRAYWDNAHPTEAANKVLAKRAYKAHGPGDAYPMDISQLVRLNLKPRRQTS